MKHETEIKPETIPQMRARHEKEFVGLLQRQINLGVTQTQASKNLGIERTNLNQLIKKRGIKWPKGLDLTDGVKHAKAAALNEARCKVIELMKSDGKERTFDDIIYRIADYPAKELKSALKSLILDGTMYSENLAPDIRIYGMGERA